GAGGAETQPSAGRGRGRRAQDTAARNDVILFSSRRIGLSPAFAPIPIAGGGRLTGRVNRDSVGVLNIQQRETADSRATNFTALRLRRDLFANSDVGVILLNKDAAGPAFNRVLGFDANFRFFQNLNLNANYTKTISPASTDIRGSDSMVNAKSTYRGAVWEFRGSYATIGERFDDQMGYVPRIGISKTQTYVAQRLGYQCVSG